MPYELGVGTGRWPASGWRRVNRRPPGRRRAG